LCNWLEEIIVLRIYGLWKYMDYKKNILFWRDIQFTNSYYLYSVSITLVIIICQTRVHSFTCWKWPDCWDSLVFYRSSIDIISTVSLSSPCSWPCSLSSLTGSPASGTTSAYKSWMLTRLTGPSVSRCQG